MKITKRFSTILLLLIASVSYAASDPSTANNIGKSEGVTQPEDVNAINANEEQEKSRLSEATGGRVQKVVPLRKGSVADHLKPVPNSQNTNVNSPTGTIKNDVILIKKPE